ncbi:hypothetical protein Patl1_31085 [Pistacia atlantica]|uniref:Uncharacterized protein n=1 Tax=Pistacia atlantica TaxID=434234 RepID=A0ACC1A9M0_9ROSI|nr:hypothetical protein Patl1_31085 [Pistacia atlantica]
MGLKVRLCLCLLLAFAVLSSARNIISPSGNNNIDEMVGDGRSLMAVSVNDYSEPSANRGHDPRSKGGGGGGGRKG